MAKYVWREGGPKPKVDADTFGEVVERIAAGQPLSAVDPKSLVDAARVPNSPIRELFNWNDKKAAELYRRQQARHYLGALQIVRVSIQEGPQLSSRAYYSMPPRKGYVSRDEVMSDRDLRRMVIGGAKRELESYVTKYQSVIALGSVIPTLQHAIDAMRDEIDRLEFEATRRSAAAAEPAMAEAAE